MIERAVSATPEDIMRAARARHVTRSGRRGRRRRSAARARSWSTGGGFARGEHVVLRPERNRNAQDHLLAGRSATIERILVDYDDQVHLCVTVDDDPGQDLMRDIGRYLYFKPTEVEVIGP